MKKNIINSSLVLILLSAICPNNIYAKKHKSSSSVLTIAIIKSFDLKQFHEVADGFKESVVSADNQFNVIDFVIEKELDEGGVKEFIQKNKPDMIFCFGSRAALNFARYEKKIPIVFTLILNYKRFKDLNQSNVAGIAMEIPAQNILTQFKFLCTKLSSVAVPFNPSASQEIVDNSLKIANNMNVNLLPLSINDPSTLNDNLIKKKTYFDSIWMISDFKLYNKENISEVTTMFNFAKQEKKPILVAASEEFLKAGGLFSISISYKILGSQLFVMANKIANNVKVKDIGVALPFGTKTILNLDVAKNLVGYAFDEFTLESFQSQVDSVYTNSDN